MNLRTCIFFAALSCCINIPAHALPELKMVSVWHGQSTTPYGPADSFVYVHSHGRNSVGKTVEWSHTSGFAQIPTMPTITEVYDTCYQYRYNASHTYDPYNRYFQTFDANNNLTHILVQHYDLSTASWADLSATKYTFNSDNTLAASASAGYNKIAAQWDSATSMSYTYYPGKLLATSMNKQWNKNTLTWNLYEVDTFTYDVNGNQTGIHTWNYINNIWTLSPTSMVYNSSNQLISDTITIPGNTDLTNTFFYNSAGLLTTRIMYSNYTKDTSEKFIYSYDASGNQLGASHYFFNTTTRLFTRVDTLISTYNTNGQIDSWTDTQPGGKTYQKFYYGPSTGHVANVPDANGMKLYPVPAVAYVNLEAELGTQQDISIMITDMTGRCVKQFKESASGHYKKFIPLMELPAGTYTITLTGKATSSQQFSVIH